jgi:hypothetical protein
MYRWRPLGTARFRWRGPNVDQARPARGGSGAPRGGPWLARRPPPAAPDKRARPGDRLVRGSPGGVWARDIPLYRRAVPGHRHGGTPAPCLSKPCPRRWLLDHGPRWRRNVEAARSWRHGVGARRLERWDSKPPPPCADGRGAGHEGGMTCSSEIPLVTAHGRPGPAVPGAVRTQRGPASSARVGSGPVRLRTPSALWSSAARDRSGRPGTARPIPSPRMGIGGTGLHSVTLRH